MEASLNSPLGRINLTSTNLTIGCAPDNQLVLPDQQASSYHAQIRPDAQGYLLVDFNSTNGTFVNEQRLPPRTPRLLISGDLIRIGETRLSYEIAGSYDATLRTGASEYVNPGYSPTVAVPPGYPQVSQPGYPAYQQPSLSSPNYPQAANPEQQSYPGYQPPTNYSPQEQGYPQEPWTGAPGQIGVPVTGAAAQPKKRRTGLIIGLIVLVLLVVGGGVGVYVFGMRSTPEKALQAYCTALENGDAQGIFNLESSNEQKHTSLNEIKLGLALFASPLGGNGVKNCVVGPVTNNNGTTANGSVTITLGNGKPQTSSGVLVNENGSWKLGNSQSAP